MWSSVLVVQKLRAVILHSPLNYLYDYFTSACSHLTRENTG